MKQASISRFSISNIFLECLTFTWRNLGDILRRTWLLAIVCCAIFYFFFNEYIIELAGFLAAPTEAGASIVLGLVSASVLLLLFVYTLAVAAVTDLALGHRRQRGIFYIRIGHQEGRLYAASLRLFLLMIIFIAAAYLIILGIKTARLGYVAQYAMEAGTVVILATVALRLGFLLPAVAMAETRGVIIRKSWKLSEGIFLHLLLFAMLVVLPGLLMELSGELVARAMRLSPVLHLNGTLQDYINAFHHLAPVFSILLCLPLMITALLYAIASAIIYRALIGTSPLAD